MIKLVSVIVQRFLLQENESLNEWELYAPKGIPTQVLLSREDDVVGGNCGIHVCA